MNQENLKIYLIFLFAFILGISIDYLFYGKPAGISFFIFVSIFLIFSLILAKKFGSQLTKVQYALLIPIILFSAMVFLRTNGFLSFFNIVGGLFFIFLFLALFSEKNLFSFGLQKYLVAPISFLVKSFSKSARFIEEYIDKIQTKRKFGSPKFRSIIKGVCISIPVLTLFIWLFASADIVFQKYLNQLLKYLDVTIAPEMILRTLIVLVAFYFFVGIFAKILANKEAKSTQLKENGSEKLLGNIESSVILSSVCLLFLIFIAIQFVYLFGGASYVWGIEEYITYSEYAKKGFGELIAVAIISLLLIYGIDKFGKRENLKQKNLFKILSGVLVLEILIIMASSFSRLSLYVDGYGYTLFRFLSFVFLFWLFSVFLLFLYKIFSEKKESLFLFAVFGLTILFWAGINFLNPDAFIAKKNIERCVQGKELDYRYFRRMSDDAIPEMVKIFNLKGCEKEKIEMARELSFQYELHPLYLIYPWAKQEQTFAPYKRKTREEIKMESQWQSFNVAKEKSLIAVRKNSQEIKKYLILFWDKEIERCLGEMKKCEKEERGGCNFIKDDCEKFQERKTKLEETLDKDFSN